MRDETHTDSRLALLADVSPAPLVVSRRFPNRERRNPIPRQALAKRICEEFIEMPGTCLTLAQACRLFGLPRDMCARIFDELVNEGRLRVLPDHRYRLHSAA
jgi:hypothetical protein